MKAKLIRRAMQDNGFGNPQTRLEKGAVIDHPHAYQLVGLGMCVPADDECALACGMDEKQMAAVIKAQDAVSKGIHPSDYAAFYAGEMVGYDEHGNFIPGPNASTFGDDEEDDDDDGGIEV